MSGGALMALIVLSAVGIFLGSRAIVTAGGEVVERPIVEACNGFRQLCDRRVDQVVFLGTHNSMSAASEPGWYFPNHLTGIRAQLDACVRVLLLDTYYGYNTGRGVRTAELDFVAEPPGEFSEQVVESARCLAQRMGGIEAGEPLGTYLCHTYCELGATPLLQALSEINRFLDETPGRYWSSRYRTR